MVEQGVFPADAPANHCLVNEYLPGQGIMASNFIIVYISD
jgi:hypothetical protein